MTEMSRRLVSKNTCIYLIIVHSVTSNLWLYLFFFYQIAFPNENMSIFNMDVLPWMTVILLISSFVCTHVRKCDCCAKKVIT